MATRILGFVVIIVLVVMIVQPRCSSSYPRIGCILTIPPPGPIVEVWEAVLKNDYLLYYDYTLVLESLQSDWLRRVRYTTSDQSDAILVADGVPLYLPSLNRHLADSITTNLALHSPDQQANYYLKLDALYAGIMESWPTLNETWQREDTTRFNHLLRPNRSPDRIEARSDGVPWVYEQAILWRIWINGELVKLAPAARAAEAYKPAEREALLRQIGKSGEFYREDPIP